jgi:hypothetical protein
MEGLHRVNPIDRHGALPQIPQNHEVPQYAVYDEEGCDLCRELTRLISAVIFVVTLPFQAIALLFLCVCSNCCCEDLSCSDFRFPFFDEIDIHELLFSCCISYNPEPQMNPPHNLNPVNLARPMDRPRHADPVIGRIAIDSVQGVSLKAIEATRGYILNPLRIRDVPPPLNIEELRLNGTGDIPIDELLVHFDTIFQYETGRQRLAEIQHAKPYITQYINFIKARQDQSGEYFDQLLCLAQNLIIELRKPEILLHKKQTALLEIADAQEKCKPRRFEETKRQFQEVSNRAETLEDKFLRWIQMFKEEIIIKTYQGTQFHVINRARIEIGEEWGLDRNAISTADEHIGCGGNTTKEEYRQTLTQNCTPASLVAALRTRIEYDGLNRDFSDYLSHFSTELPENYDDAEEGFFDIIVKESGGYEAVLNERGITWLLEHFKFITKRDAG